MPKCPVCQWDLKPDSKFCSQCGNECVASAQKPEEARAADHKAPEESAGHNRPREISDQDLSFNSHATPVERLSDDDADAKPRKAARASKRSRAARRATRKALSTAALLLMMVVVSTGTYFLAPRLFTASGGVVTRNPGVTIGDAPERPAEDPVAAQERAQKQQESNNLDQQIIDQKSKLDETTNLVTAAKDELDKVRAQIARLKNELATVKASLTTLKAEVAGKRKELDGLEVSLSKLKGEQQRLEVAVRNGRRDKRRLQDQVAAKKREVTRLDNTVAAKKREVAKLDDQIASGERRARRLRKDIDGLRRYDAGR